MVNSSSDDILISRRKLKVHPKLYIPSTIKSMLTYALAHKMSLTQKSKIRRNHLQFSQFYLGNFLLGMLHCTEALILHFFPRKHHPQNYNTLAKLCRTALTARSAQKKVHARIFWVLYYVLMNYNFGSTLVHVLNTCGRKVRRWSEVFINYVFSYFANLRISAQHWRHKFALRRG